MALALRLFLRPRMPCPPFLRPRLLSLCPPFLCPRMSFLPAISAPAQSRSRPARAPSMADDLMSSGLAEWDTPQVIQALGHPHHGGMNMDCIPGMQVVALSN